MPRRPALVLTLLLLVPGAHGDNASRGQARELSLPVAGATRWFTVYQTPGYRPGAPVVLLLHGGGMSMRKIFSARAGGMRQWLHIADRENFLLLIPNATNGKTGDPKGDRQNWNDLREPGATGKAVADDVGFLMQLLDWAQDKYRYDPRRVYVTGASNGGMMTFRLLLEQPRRFTAAAVFIASLPATAPARPPDGPRVPLLLFNGTHDPLIQWQGGEIPGRRGTTMAIEPMVQWWREVNGATRWPTAVGTMPDRDPDDGCRITRTVWNAETSGGAPVEFYRADGGGHALPSIAHPLNLGPFARRIIGPVCRDVEGAELAWDFLKRHPTP